MKPVSQHAARAAQGITPNGRARTGLPVLSTVVCASVLLGACSITETINEKTAIDYRSATKPSRRLDVPPDLVDPRSDDRFRIPEVTAKERTFSGYQTAQGAVVSPDKARVLAPMQGMRIERAGTQRWLVVEQPADVLWPKVAEFWRESGFALAMEQPQIGVMETEWTENRAKIPQDIIRSTIGRFFDNAYSSGERDLFRTRFERAPGGGTEIHVTHRGMSEEWADQSKERTIWKPRPTDPELEAEFLRRLMVKLGATKEAAQQGVGAAQPSAQTAAKVVSAGGTSFVSIPEGFDRAWRHVGLALDRGGFTVEDRDRSNGLYFVRYIDPEVEGKAGSGTGFFSRLLSREKKATSAQQYRIKVEGEGQASRVSVLGKDGKPPASDFDRQSALKILNLLREQLQQ